MIRYTPQSQLTLDGFTHPFGEQLDPNNRWVRLAAILPWDKLAEVYARGLKSAAGRLSVDVRMVLGALIVKHKLNLSDRETVLQISENLYLQYFCGLPAFTTRLPFDASLFVTIRKRLGSEGFSSFNDHIIRCVEERKTPSKRIVSPSSEDPPVSGSSSGAAKVTPGASEPSADVPNKGTLMLDTTVADQQIRYPTDLGLLNESREQCERLIDELYAGLKWKKKKKKPRDYRRVARQAYLALAKKKNKSRRQLRTALKQQLQYVKRDIRIIEEILLSSRSARKVLSKRDMELFATIKRVYAQQKYLYDNKTHTCPDRIVSLHQPWVRPIVRGKDKARVEFGSKLSISQVDGLAWVDNLRWDAFNESGDLIGQVERYRSLYGRYPDLVLADAIYLTRENRKWLSTKKIRIVGRPLGRPPKEEVTAYQKRKRREERNKRNQIEGKFGEGKNRYGLNRIKARCQDTSGAWIGAIFFVMNLTRLASVAGQKILLALFICLAGLFGDLGARLPTRLKVQLNVLLPPRDSNRGILRKTELQGALS